MSLTSPAFQSFLDMIAKTRPLADSYFGDCVSMKWDAWRVVRLLNAELDRLALTPPRTVLDLGCGIGVYEGELRRRWPATRLTGVDFSRRNILAARTHEPTATFLHGDAESLPLSNATIDLALAIEVMEHFLHPERAVAELARVVRPGGLLIVVVPLSPPIPFVRTISRVATRFIGSKVIEEGEFKEHMRIYRRRTLLREFGVDWKVRRLVTFNLMTFVVAAMEKISGKLARGATERSQRLLDSLDLGCGHFLYAKALLVLERKGRS